MSNFLFSLNVILPLFVVMGAGYFLRIIKFIDLNFLGQLNRFVFKFLLPLMLFHDISTSYNGNFSNQSLIWASLIGTTAVILLSFLVVPFLVKRKGQRGSVIQGIYRSNFLIYGLPLATAMYGDDARSAISMLMVIMIPFYNVMAVIILSIYSETNTVKPTVKSVLLDIVKNPLIIGCATGLLAGIIQLDLPRFLQVPISQLATAAAPLALFVMGGEFEFHSLKGNIRKVIGVTIARLILVPVVALYIFVQMGFREVDLAVLISIFATPAAMAGYIMAKNMGCDGKLSAQIVVLSTASSCVTIFFIVYFLRMWGYI